jgi:predicted acylesterase/phospholipase RssA
MLIVAFTGGSVGGYGTACYMEHLYNAMNTSWGKYIQMIAGVSAGSLVGGCIAYKNMNPTEMKTAFREGMSRIFKTNWFTKRWYALRGLLWGTIYESKKLQKEVDRIFGSTLIGAETDLKFMTYATQGSPELVPKHWKSWKQDTGQLDRVADVLTASCSIPFFFAPKTIKDGVYVDGGLITNAPTMQAYAEALRMNVPADKIWVLTIQCLGSMRNIPRMSKLRSAISWARPIVPAMVSADEASVDYEARTILGNRYMRINLGLNVELDDIDSAACEKMEKRAKDVWDWSKVAVMEFIRQANAT